MKNKEIIEGNKLIAEFMEVKIGVDTYMYRPGVTDLLREDHLSYHSSWDWLMPVVEKIAGNFDVTISSVGLWVTYIDRIDTKWEDKHIGDMGGHKPIVNTWKAVVQFIEWYNKQPKYKKS